jgi:predicted NBD/HSP70 family sugar kinase
VNKFELKSLLDDGALGTPAGRIVRMLTERGAMSAAQLSRLTGLAKSTVSTAVAELRRSGMVLESGSESGGGVGRPARALTLNPGAGTCIGILIGQTEIEVIVADVAHTVLSDKIIVLEDGYTPVTAARIIRQLVAEAYESQWQSPSGLLGVGVAVGGPVNPVNGRVLRAGGMPDWAGVDIRELLGPLFEGVPIFCDNESNCSAIAEMTWGAAQGFDDFVVYTLDLGVGGAIVSGGRVLRGIAGGAGEFGHVVVDPNGPLCRCGNHGCLEVYASFRGLLTEAERHFERPLRIIDVVEMAMSGNAYCRALVERAGESGGYGLGLIGSVLNPPLVVVSGRLALTGDLLMGPLTRSYERYTLIKHNDVPDVARTVFRSSSFTDGACLGAVGLVLRHHGRLVGEATA